MPAWSVLSGLPDSTDSHAFLSRFDASCLSIYMPAHLVWPSKHPISRQRCTQCLARCLPDIDPSGLVAQNALSAADKVLLLQISLRSVHHPLPARHRNFRSDCTMCLIHCLYGNHSSGIFAECPSHVTDPPSRGKNTIQRRTAQKGTPIAQ